MVRQSDSGVTLIELLLVILLLSLVYGLTVPALGSGATGVELRTATRQVVAGLNKARSLAVHDRHDAALSLDVEARTLAVSSDPRVYTLPEHIDLALFTAQSEAMNERQGSIRFFPDGSSTGGRITLSAGADKRYVDIDWLTGLATVR